MALQVDVKNGNTLIKSITSKERKLQLNTKNQYLDDNITIDVVDAGVGSVDVTASKAQVLAGYTTVTSDSNNQVVQGDVPTFNWQYTTAHDTNPKTSAQASASGYSWNTPTTITFSIHRTSDTLQYTCESNMTWHEFACSPYNTNSLVYTNNFDNLYIWNDAKTTEGSITGSAGDIIVNGTTYETTW